MAWSKIISRCQIWFQNQKNILELKVREIISLCIYKDAPFPHAPVLYGQAIRNYLFGGGLMFVMGMSLLWGGTWYMKNQYQNIHQTVSIWSFAKTIGSSQILKESDFKSLDIPKGMVSSKAIKDLEKLVGKTLLFPVEEREIALEKHVYEDINKDSVSNLFVEGYGVPVDADWFISSLPEVYKNDRVDIFVYKAFSELQDTEVLIQGARVLTVQKSRGKRSSIILNLTEQDSKALFFAKSLGMPLQIVVSPSLSS